MNGDVIAGSWTLAGFDISQAGADLVISQAGADLGLSATPKITVKNFPFSQSRGAFGVTLGKKADLALDRDGKVISTSGYDLETKSLPQGYYFNGGPFPKLGSNQDQFFGLLRHHANDITITDQHVLARFNAKGEILEFQPLHDSLPVT